MKNTLSNLLFFAVGAAIGSAVTWKFVKTKYEKIAQEEIESVREMYESENGIFDDSEESEDDADEGDSSRYVKLVNNSGYISDDQSDEEEEEVEEDMIEPYVIVPEEFDEIGYETMTLFYYADGVLAYGDTNEVVEDVSELVCEDFAEHFGEYEADSVFVRNDNIQFDIEILKDSRRYSEVE